MGGEDCAGAALGFLPLGEKLEREGGSFFGDGDLSDACVAAFGDGEEVAVLEGFEVAGEGCALHAEVTGEARGGDGAGLGEGGEDSELGGAQAGAAELGFEVLGEGPGGAAVGGAEAIAGGEEWAGRGAAHIRVYTPI